MAAPKNIELARRAVKLKHWRWMPGMRGIASKHAFFRVSDNGRRDDKYGQPLGLPDFDDTATVGCLLALVRQAWGAPWPFEISFHTDDGCVVRIGTMRFAGDSLAQALVAALRAAEDHSSALADPSSSAMSDAGR